MNHIFDVLTFSVSHRGCDAHASAKHHGAGELARVNVPDPRQIRLVLFGIISTIVTYIGHLAHVNVPYPRQYTQCCFGIISAIITYTGHLAHVNVSYPRNVPRGDMIQVMIYS